jgi:hypothetical protein
VIDTLNDMDAARGYWASMTYEEKLFFVATNGNAACFAYDRLTLHRGAAHRQMARINQAIAASFRPEPATGATQEEMRSYVRDGKQRMEPLLSEVHFYFASWSGCRNMMQILVGQPEFLEAKKVFDRYRKEFDHYVAARNTFEHFHDRLPGQPEERRVKEALTDPKGNPHRIYAGFSKGHYVHSDMSWDISTRSLELLDQYISEVLAVVHATLDEVFNRKFMSNFPRIS